LTTSVKRKRKFSYFSAILSIAMVLLMLGLLGFLFLGSKAAENYLRENMMVQAFLQPELGEAEIQALSEKIKAAPFTAELSYTSKERAAIEFSNELGQDFASFLGYNPLMPSFQIRLNGEFNNVDKLPEVEQELKKMSGVTDVNYPRAAFGNAQENIQKVGALFIGLAAIFGMIAVVLIHNTVRLNLYARRFTIKSMQLVGATHGFIIKPFLVRGFINGIWGWLLAAILLFGIQKTLPTWIPEWESFFSGLMNLSLFGGLLLIGVFISVLSSLLSTLKFLNTRLDDLY
jgi:cell division transport system permease protein